MTINEQTYRFYPFNDNFQYTFTLDGTLGAGESPTHIEAQVLNQADDSVLVNWTQLSNESIVAETSWSGELTVTKQDAEFYFKVRLDQTETTAQTSNNCSVALIVTVIGQSLAAYHFTGTATTVEDRCYVTTNGTTFSDTDSDFGYGGSRFANLLSDEFSCPIVIFKRGVGGSALAYEYRGFWPFWWEDYGLDYPDDSGGTGTLINTHAIDPVDNLGVDFWEARLPGPWDLGIDYWQATFKNDTYVTFSSTNPDVFDMYISGKLFERTTSS